MTRAKAKAKKKLPKKAAAQPAAAAHDDAPPIARKKLSADEVRALERGLDMATPEGQDQHALRLMRKLLEGRLAADIVKAYCPLAQLRKSLMAEANAERRGREAKEGVEIVKGARTGGASVAVVAGPPPDDATT